MKILMVLESDFPPDIRVENEIEALSNAGHEVHIACYSHQKQFTISDYTSCIIHKKYISRIRYKSSVGALKFGFYFRFWKRFLREIFANHSFNAIHIHDLPLAKIGFEFSKKYQLKFILDLHENWHALLEISTHTQTFLGKLLCSIPQWEKYEKEYVARADRIIVVVDEMKERVVKLGVLPEKISVVANTLNLKLFNFPEPLKDHNHVTLVYGGGVNYHRGLQYALRAIPLLKEKVPNIRLWIIGGGSYLENLKTEAASLSISSYVTFWGWKKQHELLELVSQSDYAIIPHISSAQTEAGLPHKLFQYMYAGIPILASDCAPVQRIISETGTGLIFRNKDAESFAETLLNLISDKSFREQIPENGRKWVQEKYNWNRDAEFLVELYADFQKS